jgi:hypothetical protein
MSNFIMAYEYNTGNVIFDLDRIESVVFVDNGSYFLLVTFYSGKQHILAEKKDMDLIWDLMKKKI